MPADALTTAEPQGLFYVPQRAVGKSDALPGPAFPGSELVAAAAAMFQRGPRSGWVDGVYRDGRHLPAFGVHYEARRFALVISGGTVGVGMTDPRRKERTAAAARDRLTREVFAPEREQYEGVSYGPTFGAAAALELPAVYGAPARTLEWGVYEVEDYEGAPQWREPNPARTIVGWSPRSRARMVRTLAQLDWAPMYASGRLAGMVTLTYPGNWEALAPTGADLKRHLKALRKRWVRAWGADMVGPWKLEYQRRGAPHVHFMLVTPAGSAACHCADCRCWCLLPDCGAESGCARQLLFREWLSHTWADVIGARADVDRYGHPLALGYGTVSERRASVLAGTGVDYVKGGRAFDPKRAAVYFSKHGGAAGGKEYQHVVPALWQREGAGPGRFWGYWGLEKVTAQVTLTAAEYVLLRRTFRRWSRAQRRTRVVRRERVNTRTGAVSYRPTTVRAVLLAQGGMQGGTLVVNDGPEFARKLSRLLE